MTDSSNPDPSSKPSNDSYDVGYRKPPKYSQFEKGKSGNLHGRPKKPVGVSLKEILDGDQLGKNGKIVSRREAYVIALINDALSGNQKSFAKFMKLMYRAGLVRKEAVISPSVIHIPERTMTAEEYQAFRDNFLAM